MTTKKDYDAAADWAEHDMTLKADSATALHGQSAAEHGRAALARATGGRPALDPSAEPGVHARPRQVRLPAEANTRLDEVAAMQHRKPSAVMRDAILAYLSDVERHVG